MVLHDISVGDLSVESTIMQMHREKYAYHMFPRANRHDIIDIFGTGKCQGNIYLSLSIPGLLGA